MEKLIGNENLPSSLERDRVRELKLFREKIANLQNEIKKIEQSHPHEHN